MENLADPLQQLMLDIFQITAGVEGGQPVVSGYNAIVWANGCGPSSAASTSIVSVTQEQEQEQLEPKTMVIWDIKTYPVPPRCDAGKVRRCFTQYLRKLGRGGPLSIVAVGTLTDVSEDILRDFSSSGICLYHIAGTHSLKNLTSFKITDPVANIMFVGDVDEVLLGDIKSNGVNFTKLFTDNSPHSEHLWEKFLLEAPEEQPEPKTMGVPTKNDGFSLTSGDFPCLGAEKESSEKSTKPQANERRENRNETNGEAQPTKAPSLIQKIEVLNAKTRINDRRPTQQTQGRADLQTKGRVNSEGNDGWRRTTVMSGSSRATLATNSETFPEVNVGDSLDTDSIRRPGSGISADPNDNQRSMMRELARQRAQQRQKEEEERARVQRATALAKLEELNRRSQTEQIAAKNQTTSKDDGWNDGWYMTPETHYPTAEEMEASAAGKDQGMSIHGKQHASRSNKDGGSNYGDPKKANKRDPNKAHMQHSVHGLSQPDIPVTSKESRGPGDHVWHTSNTTGKYGGRENTREKSYGSQKKDVAGYEHQGFSTEQKKTSADTHGQLQNPNSMFPKNTGQSRRFGRGQESQGGRCGSPVQENMHLHHQRPGSNRDRQKQNTMHYEYKPVGSHTNDGERNREQLKDNTQTEGPRYREKGHGQQRHGGYQQQRGTSGGRNTGHGLAGERN